MPHFLHSLLWTLFKCHNFSDLCIQRRGENKFITKCFYFRVSDVQMKPLPCHWTKAVVESPLSIDELAAIFSHGSFLSLELAIICLEYQSVIRALIVDDRYESNWKTTCVFHIHTSNSRVSCCWSKGGWRSMKIFLMFGKFSSKDWRKMVQRWLTFLCNKENFLYMRLCSVGLLFQSSDS